MRERRSNASIKREEFYRRVFDGYANSKGLVRTQLRHIAKDFGMDYQRVTEVLREYEYKGLLRRNGPQFIMKPPDSVDWVGYVPMCYEDVVDAFRKAK